MRSTPRLLVLLQPASSCLPLCVCLLVVATCCLVPATCLLLSALYCLPLYVCVLPLTAYLSPPACNCLPPATYTLCECHMVTPPTFWSSFIPAATYIHQPSYLCLSFAARIMLPASISEKSWQKLNSSILVWGHKKTIEERYLIQ